MKNHRRWIKSSKYNTNNERAVCALNHVNLNNKFEIGGRFFLLFLLILCFCHSKCLLVAEFQTHWWVLMLFVLLWFVFFVWWMWCYGNAIKLNPGWSHLLLPLIAHTPQTMVDSIRCCCCYMVKHKMRRWWPHGHNVIAIEAHE